RVLHRFEVGQNQLPVNQVTGSVKDVVRGVAGMPPNQQLSGDEFAPALLHLEVNVRPRSSGVGDWLNGTEAILSRRTRLELTEPLEILILLPRLRDAVGRVEIDLIGVALP